MKSKTLVALSLLLSCGTAYASDQKFDTLEVRPLSQFALDRSCADRGVPSPIEVERVLQINDRNQTQNLGRQLATAIGEACKSGIATIVVRRSATGQSLTWRAAHGMEDNVAMIRLTPASVASN